MFVGSALTNFGVRHLLDAIVDLAPAPSPRLDIDGVPRPIDSPCSAFVFKVQANMDRSHRDRIAFVRICSGRFERGMVLTSARTGKPFATKYASTVFGAERSTVDVAFPGDVVGLVNATGLNIGDSLYDGDPVEFPPIPRFSPEVFASARPLDSGRFKQFRRGLAQLDEEGVVQVLRDPDMGDSAPVLAAVGQLQFEVFANRLDVEFGAPIEVLSSPYEAIRLTDADVGRSAAPDRRDPGPRARRRRAGGAVREPLPARSGSSPTSPSCASTTSSPADATSASASADRRWHDFVMTKEPSGASGRGSGAAGGAGGCSPRRAVGVGHASSARSDAGNGTGWLGNGRRSCNSAKASWSSPAPSSTRSTTTCTSSPARSTTPTAIWPPPAPSRSVARARPTSSGGSSTPPARCATANCRHPSPPTLISVMT